MRAARVRFGVAAVAVLVGSCATAASAGATHQATKVVTVYPWTAAGTLKAGVKVAGTVKGTCWTSSIAVSSSTAYRCMTNHSLIYDPCFAPVKPHFAQLACMAAPWGSVIRFTLTSPIPGSAKHPSGKPRVWADQLATGIRCIVATGTGVLIDKVALNYYCVPGSGWASTPAHASEPWTVRYATSQRATKLRTVALTTAWY